MTCARPGVLSTDVRIPVTVNAQWDSGSHQPQDSLDGFHTSIVLRMRYS